MLYFKAFRLNKMLNIGGTEKNCEIYKLWVREEKGMKRIRFNPKNIKKYQQKHKISSKNIKQKDAKQHYN